MNNNIASLIDPASIQVGTAPADTTIDTPVAETTAMTIEPATPVLDLTPPMTIEPATIPVADIPVPTVDPTVLDTAPVEVTPAPMDISPTVQVDSQTVAQSKSSKFVYLLSGFWSVFAGAYILAITFIGVPKDNVRFADTVLGFLLGTVIASIINYFLGSSRSAHNQEEILLQNAKNGKL
jgi:hypothetical protein